MKKINLNYQLLLTIFIEELLFSLLIFNSYNNILLKISIIVIISLLFSLIKNKKVKIVLNIIFPFLFLFSFIYYKMYGSILTINVLINSGQAIKFISILFDIIIKNILYILLFLLPYLLLLIKKQFSLNIKLYISVLCIFIILNMSLVFTSSKNDIYSYYNLLFNIDNKQENVNAYGLIETKLISIPRLIFGFKENDNLVISNDLKKIYSKNDYNILDTSFPEGNNKDISDYLKTKEPTNKNKYTGIFKGKNLIFVLAESFSELAINEKYTPTLYEMYNESMKFTNYYSPLFPVSTSDSEYMFDYSLLPSENTWSIEKSNKKTPIYSLARLFNKMNYKTSAYHDYDYNYYNRNDYINNLGFSTYKGCGNGLENKINCKLRYPSDYELFNSTIDDYIKEDNFYTYYISYSGHGKYDNNQEMSMKNYNLITDNYDETVKKYIAANMELDKGMEVLINKLEENNKLDDTVIVIVPDHYPYTLDLSTYNKALGTNKDNVFEKNKMPLIIYNNGNYKDDIISKQSSSLDILPTLLNMYGIDYDSRLLMGNDIMSDSKELVIFSNRSFLIKDGYYNSLTEDTKNISSDQLKQYKEDIYRKYKYSRLMLENDYYKNIIK